MIMLKKISLLLLSFSVAFIVEAQTITNISVLQNFAKKHKATEDLEYAKAVAMAKQKGWPVIKKMSNVRILSLQRIDPFGNPLYYTTFNNTIAAATTRASQLWPGGSSGPSASL